MVKIPKMKKMVQVKLAWASDLSMKVVFPDGSSDLITLRYYYYFYLKKMIITLAGYSLLYSTLVAQHFTPMTGSVTWS